MIDYDLYSFLNEHYSLNLTKVDAFKTSYSRQTYSETVKATETFIYPEREMTPYDYQIVHGMIKAGELYGIKKKSFYYILHTNKAELKPFIILVVKKDTEYIIDIINDETIDMLYDYLYNAYDDRDYKAIERLKEIRREEGISSKFKKKFSEYHNRINKKYGINLDREKILYRYFNIKGDITRPYRQVDPLTVIKKYVQDDGKTVILPNNNDYHIIYRLARKQGVSVNDVVKQYGYFYKNQKSPDADDLMVYFNKELSKISDDTGCVKIAHNSRLYRQIYRAGKENDMTVDEMVELLEFKRIL